MATFVVINRSEIVRAGVMGILGLAGHQCFGVSELATAIELATTKEVTGLIAEITGYNLRPLLATKIPVVVLTNDIREHRISKAVNDGVRAYLPLGVSAAELTAFLDIIISTSNGAVWTATALSRFSTDTLKKVLDIQSSLSYTALAIAALIAQDKSTAEIMSILSLAESSVDNWVSALIKALHVRSRIGIAIWAHDLGLDELFKSGGFAAT